ncbi:MAG: adenylosuccinate lyase [Armatimonadetes bacterium]|nr:adenylosuccinate lyase [Armatimonadota bacterium]
MEISIYDCVSPLDFRYYGQDEKLRELLAPYVSERGRLRAMLAVEVAVARVLARRGLCPPEAAEEIAAAAENVSPEEVAQEEDRIHHDVRAMVNVLRRYVSEKARPYVHFTLTSYDVVDTARAWLFRSAAHDVIIPELKQLEQVLIDLALREKDTLQIGRTHGQHAVPITFGFAIAQYVNRLGDRIEAIAAAADRLPGKVSGAVGAYNASSLFFDDPVAFEREVLQELGLPPAIASTQIVPPEPTADFIHALISTFGVLANLADDMRHLQRTEIAEVGEEFKAEQVGSSTMPHKRNPWNFENVKSFWKAFAPRMMTVYMDQISEHQRDLTNSATQRFLPEIIVGLVSTVRRLRRVMSRLVTDDVKMRQNLEMTRGLIAAEPAYLLLAAHGHPDAHERVRQLTLEAEATGRPLGELLAEAEDLRPYWEKFTDAQRDIIIHPDRYTGIASAKAQRVCEYWRERLGLIP